MSRITDTYPIVQVSLDLTSLEESIATARTAVEAGVDWLEAGTPLLLAEGLHAVEGLRREFPDHPVVADLKTMDGGYLEAEMMAKAGADVVVVMSRAHPATIECVVKCCKDYGIRCMGDELGEDDKPAAARMLEDLGVDYIIHHVGYDERNKLGGPSPLAELESVVRAVDIPVQAVGGLTIEQAIDCPRHGAPLVVIGAPLAIEGHALKPGPEMAQALTEICTKIRNTPYVRPA
jgi:3-hexulose-6-phosphate synthase/6-phospho-3-hexuloisomerase